MNEKDCEFEEYINDLEERYNFSFIRGVYFSLREKFKQLQAAKAEAEGLKRKDIELRTSYENERQKHYVVRKKIGAENNTLQKRVSELEGALREVDKEYTSTECYYDCFHECMCPDCPEKGNCIHLIIKQTLNQVDKKSCDNCCKSQECHCSKIGEDGFPVAGCCHEYQVLEAKNANNR